MPHSRGRHTQVQTHGSSFTPADQHRDCWALYTCLAQDCSRVQGRHWKAQFHTSSGVFFFFFQQHSPCCAHPACPEEQCFHQLYHLFLPQPTPAPDSACRGGRTWGLEELFLPWAHWLSLNRAGRREQQLSQTSQSHFLVNLPGEGAEPKASAHKEPVHLILLTLLRCS